MPTEWSDKYKGQFDQGWDALREETFARQKELGVIPADAELTARPAEIPAWDDMPDDAEAGAGPPDGGLRRVPGAHRPPRRAASIEALAGPARSSTTRWSIYIIGDNGASAEGTMQRHVQRDARSSTARRRWRPPSSWLERIDKFGTPTAYNHYAVGWAHAMDTPYQWTKQVASHWGGTRNGTIVHWPTGIKAKGEIRDQFHHVIDVAADRPRGRRPAAADVRQRRPADAAARASAWLLASTTPTAPERHETQYFEMFVQPRHLPQGLDRGDPAQHAVGCHRRSYRHFDDDVWELYGTRRLDPGPRPRRASTRTKLHELQRLFLIEAAKYNVLPLDDRRIERFNPDLAGRPQLITGQAAAAVRRHGAADRELRRRRSRTSRTRSPPRSTCPTAAPQGVIIAQGGAFGGWSLYAKEGRPAYCYNLFGLTALQGRGPTQPIPPGEHQVRMEFAYDGGGLGKGGDGHALHRRRPRSARAGSSDRAR